VWGKVVAAMEGHPERMKVVRTLLDNGLAIRNSRIFLNQIEIPTVKVARVAEVDRRTVSETIRMIEKSSELKTVFSQFESAGLSLKGVAKYFGLGVVEIIAADPHKAGIIANSARLMLDAGVSIRQALVDDPELAPDPKLVLIGDRPVPGELIPKLLKIEGVAKVSVY